MTFVGFVLGHGGDALQMLELAAGVKARGASVRIIVPATDESVLFAERASERGVECRRTNLVTATMGGARQSLRAMLRLFRSIDSPVVHIHTGNSCLPRMAMIALELLRYRKGVVTLHSPYETIQVGSRRARFWAATANRRFVAVVSPSRHGTRFQVSCGVDDDRATRIANCVDVHHWSTGEGQRPRADVGAKPDDPLIVFSSRIADQKRPVDAVRIFAGVAADFPAAQLVFVGDGDAVPAVAAMAANVGVAERVRLIGYRTDVADWLAAATVWILPTERENFSVAVLEALAAGCAVLATRCPGNDEVLVDGENALTFEVGDVDAATGRLRTLLCDAELRSRLSANAAQDGREYSPANMVDRYVDLYRRAATVPGALRS